MNRREGLLVIVAATQAARVLRDSLDEAHYQRRMAEHAAREQIMRAVMAPDDKAAARLARRRMGEMLRFFEAECQLRAALLHNSQEVAQRRREFRFDAVEVMQAVAEHEREPVAA
jgi:hypothetical protein